jgi:3-phosphoshikimate 1-carboxyvinyltransferase
VTDYALQPARRPLNADVTVPGSKSLTNRALIAAGLAEGHSVLSNILLADDTRLMIDALRTLGLAVTVDEAELRAEISGCGGQIPVSEATIHCGNAGTVMRFLTAVLAGAYGEFELDGVARMRQRPIGDLVDVLRVLGTGVEYLGEEGCPPLRIHARHLRGDTVQIDSPESSQFVSGLLLASSMAGADMMIDVRGDVVSRPYLRMTVRVMDAFGVAAIEQYDAAGAKFIVPAPQRYTAAAYAIEPDASNATYFLAAAAVAGGRVSIPGLGTASVQGDARFVDVLEKMGCDVNRGAETLTVRGPGAGQRLRGVDVDLADMPDTAQTLAVVALFAEGPTTIRGVANLRVKETDRLAALDAELTRLGAKVDQRDDGLTIHPPAALTPCTIQTYDDHRMAMSFALAGLRAAGLRIADPGCCAKTFPDFFARWEAMLAAV